VTEADNNSEHSEATDPNKVLRLIHERSKEIKDKIMKEKYILKGN
jgi:hypothetical protein